MFAFTLTVKAESFAEVLQWMYDNGLTSYDTEIGFMPDDYLQRGQAAKFIATYGEMIGLEETNTNCTFDDIADYDATLVPYIQKACALGLLKGSQGKFGPEVTMTQAQAMTMIVRIREGFMDETTDPWYQNYSASAKANGIVMQNELSNTPDATPVARGIMAKWLYRSNMLRTHNPDAGNGDDGLVTPPSEEEMPMEDKVIDPNAPQGYLNYDAGMVTAALDAGQTVVLYFFAGRCPNCQTMDRALSNDMAELPADTVVFKVDYDSANALKMTHGVTTQHTFVHLNSDGTAHAMSNQLNSLDALWAWIEGGMM
jgi:thiol-disulfide isomerase/thioredoxin